MLESLALQRVEGIKQAVIKEVEGVDGGRRRELTEELFYFPHFGHLFPSNACPP